ncbi:Copper transport protein-like protein [Emericellopsis cladophorae]|uniref:Copper transport protein n=1 Tax=Emericellopsis cladophorae TaxID=2686198 RepID=A0A9Q0BD89_9HYPO|nr:Copper transport protein-like protein [Emericellopsis cladophorae]KAI6781622.1 Copper transport protein-like protein [Emericellopsis cladophorae]
MSHNHGGGDTGGATECKIEMLWNWHTIDACFLSESWRIENQGMMAATCIGVMLLAVLIEFSRRLGKEYDAYLTRQFQRQACAHGSSLAAKGCGGSTEPYTPTITYRATVLQQFIRALLHAVTYGGAYIVMLLVMYFNGYIIISVFVGAGLGKFLCDWMVVKIDVQNLEVDRAPAGIDEATVCCG